MCLIESLAILTPHRTQSNQGMREHNTANSPKCLESRPQEAEMAETEGGKLAGSGYEGPHVSLLGVQNVVEVETLKVFNQGL